jgi:adenosylmethionine-8-amino-7-oxononanoate aminotransferase
VHLLRAHLEVIAEPGKGRCFTHGFTYSGHPVCCTAALKNIEIIERENLLAHVDDVGGYLEQRLPRWPICRWWGVRCHEADGLRRVRRRQTHQGAVRRRMNIGEKIHVRAQARACWCGRSCT